MVTSADRGTIRIAVLDSDTGFVRVLENRMDAVGWPHLALEAAPRVEELAAMRVDALVIDLALLGRDAWDFLERLAAAAPALEIMVCTGRSTVAQRVRGLRMGADDWITKPCHAEEVLARVESIVRRAKHSLGAGSDEEPMAAGDLEIRADQFQAFATGRSADLTRREFEVLQLLARAEGKVLQREEIYQRVWGYSMAHGDRSVDVFIRKVRQKLEAVSPEWRYIHTHFGVGYRFDPERDGGADDLGGGDLGPASDSLPSVEFDPDRPAATQETAPGRGRSGAADEVERLMSSSSFR